jgi:hypothetical protein
MHKDINCAVCFNIYDTKVHQPRILTNCGHTLCEECLRNCVVVAPLSPFSVGSSNRSSIFGNARSEGMTAKTQITIKCPLCKQSSTTTNNGTHENTDIAECFPVNYALMGAIDFIQREFGTLEVCTSHNNMLNNFCMDKNCTHRSLFCIDCVSSLHKNCQPSMIVNPISVRWRVNYAEYETSFSELSQKLSDMCQSIIQKFGTEVQKLIDDFVNGLKKEYVCLNTNDLKSFELNFRNLRMADDAESEPKSIQNLNLRPQNKELIDKNVRYEEIEKHLDAILLELPVANAKLKLNEILESVSVFAKLGNIIY